MATISNQRLTIETSGDIHQGIDIFFMLHLISIHFLHFTLHSLLRCLLGALVITSLEFAVGAVVNLGLGWDVWDYSEKPFNIMGQICPLFTLGWLALSLPGFMLCTAVEKRLSSR